LLLSDQQLQLHGNK